MSAESVLEGLRDRGFAVSVEGGRLVVRPGSELTDWLRVAIRAHKAELLALLSAAKDRRAPDAPRSDLGETADAESMPYWPIQVRWGTGRGDIAVRDPWTGQWHEFPYREAPEAWKLALRLSLSKTQAERAEEVAP